VVYRLAASLVASLALAAGLWVSGPSASAAGEPGQVITVRAQTATSTTAVLEAWEERDGEFVRVRGPIDVYVGKDGVGLASERRSRTPRGVFTLTEAFGRAKDPGTALPYVRVGLSHWWVSDVKSRYYNTMRVCKPGSHCGFRQDRAEHLGTVAPYTYAVVIDYNRDPVIKGAGSGFFLHVSEGKPTAGCVSMPVADMKWLLRWLDPADSPVISINIGDAAYDVLD
jgi:L,D-peptidoglycan transpeptidase YkuD (ErfK/YbiS/YcfS/YnhG family)